MSLTIHVRQTATQHCQAERADLRLTVSAEGGDKSLVAARTRTVLSEITDELTRVQQAGAVSRWSNDRVTTSSHRPWGDNGRRMALLHRASAQVRAVFVDFEGLANIVQPWSEIEEVAIEHVEWDLTTTTRQGVEAVLRAQAVHRATAKAQQYAQAAGLRAVHPTSIVDDDVQDGGQFSPEYARAVSFEDGPRWHFSPSDIPATVTITMDFIAD